ncbi:unnamed protein product [Prorocentrum cordatum]|uniref:Altered inheritance of mitochondria protein 24, mitochondrial n=1 Tax=Prorocentrum cordatum TaxID=2364126 RepID=A0ABN9U8J6_9DINO|nr:unnamed protein product [Polarella glacialis]
MAAVLRFEGKPSELVLLELQHNVIMEDGSKLAGQDFGVLELTKTGEVTLANGPRTCYGKMSDLAKPLVLMERTGRHEPSYGGDTARKSLVLKAHGVVRKKVVFSQRPHLSVEGAGG